ncbi:MAG: hypothetical protein EXS58_13730 [Candidatus Latescibacteria bacterium]|nr:hypothetical protein [Candidatus Latescibacterota bacterium]
MANMCSIDVHLLFREEVSLRRAHIAATRLEEQIAAALQPQQVVVTTHLECAEGHGNHHPPLMGGASRKTVYRISAEDR